MEYVWKMKFIRANSKFIKKFYLVEFRDSSLNFLVRSSPNNCTYNKKTLYFLDGDMDNDISIEYDYNIYNKNFIIPLSSQLQKFQLQQSQYCL